MVQCGAIHILHSDSVRAAMMAMAAGVSLNSVCVGCVRGATEPKKIVAHRRVMYMDAVVVCHMFTLCHGGCPTFAHGRTLPCGFDLGMLHTHYTTGATRHTTKDKCIHMLCWSPAHASAPALLFASSPPTQRLTHLIYCGAFCSPRRAALAPPL